MIDINTMFAHMHAHTLHTTHTHTAHAHTHMHAYTHTHQINTHNNYVNITHPYIVFNLATVVSLPQFFISQPLQRAPRMVRI